MAEIKTNEQEVVSAKGHIAALKENYISYLNNIVINIHENEKDPSLPELLECQRLGNSYFNYVEEFVGNSGLLGAHTNGLWVTGFAEDCLAILQTIIMHFKFLRSYKDTFQQANIEPSQNAYANMQRLIVECLPKKTWESTLKEFEENTLPIKGFKMPAIPDKNKIPKWQLVTGVILGCVLLAVSLIIAIFIPNPSPWQTFVFRGTLAIGLASIAPIIPGFINFTSRIQGRGAYFKIVAGGSIAIFVIIWLLNPPAIP